MSYDEEEVLGDETFKLTDEDEGIFNEPGNDLNPVEDDEDDDPENRYS